MRGLPAPHPLAIVSQSALPYLIIDGEGAYYQKLIKATLLVAWGLQNQ